jgi:hypothetical protein
MVVAGEATVARRTLPVLSESPPVGIDVTAPALGVGKAEPDSRRAQLPPRIRGGAVRSVARPAVRLHVTSRQRKRERLMIGHREGGGSEPLDEVTGLAVAAV